MDRKTLQQHLYGADVLIRYKYLMVVIIIKNDYCTFQVSLCSYCNAIGSYCVLHW